MKKEVHRVHKLKKTEVVEAMEGRVRRPPAWMSDYISGEELFNIELEANMVFVMTKDPLILKRRYEAQNGGE